MKSYKIGVNYLLFFFYFFIQAFFGQNQKETDSLVNLYETGNYTDEKQIIFKIANTTVNPETKLYYSDLLIKKSLNDTLILYGYLHKGNALREIGSYPQALEAYFKCQKFAKLNNKELERGQVMISIADTYSEIGNSDNAKVYYTKGVQVLRKSNDSVILGTALLNFGDEYFKNKNYDSAINLFKESVVIFKKIEHQIGTVYNLGNIGMVYAEQGKDALAEKNIIEAIAILEELQDYYPISVYLTYMSDIYLKKNDWTSAEKYSQRSLNLAEKYGLKKEISQANLQLSELHELKGNQKRSFQYYKNHITYRDSVTNIESVQKMADLRTDHEVSQKQVQVDLLNEQKKTQKIVVIATGAALFLIGLLAIGLYRRTKFIQATKKIIEEEKTKSDNLLLNILPEETAKELKLNGSVKARKFESITVLFTDFKGFTQYAEKLSPEKLVETVDFYFSKFDEILERYNLEKIKTVGDAYMCAGGLHYNKEDHAFKMLEAAIEIKEFVATAMQNNPNDETRFEVRIGINTGPVVAGVVGTKKFAYDIWGDTVNVASRMESNSEPGKINISHDTYQIIKDAFDCTYRGEIEVKNRGMMKMYFANAQKTIENRESVLQEMKDNS